MTEDPFGKPVTVPIEDVLDLHAFRPRDVPSVIDEYLAQCLEKGFQYVRIIHGRGTGTQRSIVRELLQKDPRVASFADAPAESGGWGATVVRLVSS